MRFAALVMLAVGCKEPPKLDPGHGPPGKPTVVGTYTGKLLVFPGFSPTFDASNKLVPPTASAARNTLDATVTIGPLRQGAGASKATLTIKSGESSWSMEVIAFDDGMRVGGTRPLQCGAKSTAGRIEAIVNANEIHLTELSLEEACAVGGANTRFVQFDGKR